MDTILYTPGLFRIVTEYAFPPWECTNTLTELRSLYHEWMLDELDPYEGYSFAEWWCWRNQYDYEDSDWKEQWFDQHEDEYLDRNAPLPNISSEDWPRWMDSNAFGDD